MEEGKEVVLRIFDSVIDAEVAKAHLESHGIPSTIHTTDEGGIKAIITRIHGVHLIVLGRDREAADEILKAMSV